MNVVKIVDQDIADKVDTIYIEEQFGNLENIGIVYICTRQGGDDDDWMEDSGTRYLIIHLPYNEVKKTKDARPLMLAKAKERLEMPA